MESNKNCQDEKLYEIRKKEYENKITEISLNSNLFNIIICI